MNEAMLEKLESTFNVTAKKQENPVFSCPAADLTDENKVKLLLDFYTPLVKGLDPSVGEVYMADWFQGPLLGLIYMLSAWNKTPDLTLDNLTVQMYTASYNDREYYAINFLLTNLELHDGPDEPLERASWTEEKLSRFLSQTVRPVFETIAKAGTLKTGMLWSQLPTMLEYGYERLMESEECETVMHRMTRNYEIVKSLNGAVFGKSKNPLNVKFRMTQSKASPDKQVRLKAACCLYYLVDGGHYCFTCPRVKETERDKWREEYREEQKAK
ncbi:MULTISPECIES: (2Fe-2S)-binding protein [unclassified Paenibacillus]|uniref:(2Fe-2S)-binding protein n=1 Tax=unclassified Paenibacillus TaxID=185978 RepID=UPI00020D6A15|nr:MULTISPECIES: (2Fe-2S)-binding protein [unclassified Paenibacillus]EGL17151.1 hypothetical protein HMPREF9413_3835 [Paenibacillus sp. HGF7]EPD93517.1 hypothetical protein HMPREF1207_00083 [Paenibacillus sp. HGH0039]